MLAFGGPTKKFTFGEMAMDTGDPIADILDRDFVEATDLVDRRNTEEKMAARVLIASATRDTWRAEDSVARQF
jgi:hypothetical protein